MRALYASGVNIVLTYLETQRTIEALKSLDLFVVADAGDEFRRRPGPTSSCRRPRRLEEEQIHVHQGAPCVTYTRAAAQRDGDVRCDLEIAAGPDRPAGAAWRGRAALSAVADAGGVQRLSHRERQSSTVDALHTDGLPRHSRSNAGQFREDAVPHADGKGRAVRGEHGALRLRPAAGLRAAALLQPNMPPELDSSTRWCCRPGCGRRATTTRGSGNRPGRGRSRPTRSSTSIPTRRRQHQVDERGLDHHRHARRRRRHLAGCGPRSPTTRCRAC